MITIEQCRAARGLLGWTQQDLADACGLSKTAINNFEKGHSDIKNESLKAIRMSFESADVEFIGQDGIRKKTEHVQTLKGSNAFINLLDDIYETLRSSGGEVLISNVNKRTTNQAPRQKLAQHLERLRRHNVEERVLCTEGTISSLTSIDHCRWTPKTSEAAGMATFIYGHKVAFELWEQSMIIIVNSRETCNSERRRFEHLWANADIPTVQNKKAATGHKARV